MSQPKVFLDAHDPFNRLKELERRVKNLENTPRTKFASTTAAEVANVDALVTSSALWRNLTHVGPSVTFTTGPSAKVVIIGAASCSLFPDGSGNANAYISISVDGATPVAGRENGYQLIGSGSPALLELDSPVTIAHVLTLDANTTHTITMKYMMATGTEAAWWNRVLVAMPI